MLVLLLVRNFLNPRRDNVGLHGIEHGVHEEKPVILYGVVGLKPSYYFPGPNHPGGIIIGLKVVLHRLLQLLSPKPKLVGGVRYP